MESSIPKQFLNIADYPIILSSIDRFTSVFPEIEVIVVLPKAHFTDWDKLNYDKEVTLVEGGEHRFHSVQNALKVATGDLIAIHDAVRPFVAENVIKNAFDQAEVSGAVIPVIPVKDSLRKTTFDESEPLPKGAIRIVQTPQVFKSNIIKRAYEQSYHLYFTDDATVVEECNYPIILIDGNEENIKITTPFDLRIAEVLTLTQK